ncbi:MAG: zf-HC2 domain-containing protein [Anaerolineae bacterium]|nr:zf-HC2 domain-containing protein [Anaerolineae bacterium]
MNKTQIGKTEHRYISERLSAYIDRALPERERARVQSHLESCELCREELEMLLWTKRLLRQAPTIPVPRAFVVRRADLEGRPAAKRALISPRRRTLFAAQWATALVALLFVFVLVGDVLTGGPMMPMASQAPGVAMATQAASEVMLVQEYGVAEPEMSPRGTDDGEKVGEKAVPSEAERVTSEPEAMPLDATAEATPAPEARVMVSEAEPGGAGATMDVQVAATVTVTEKAVPLAATEMTPAPETNLAAEREIATPEAAWTEPPLEEAPLPIRSPRIAWQVAEIGLGIALAALIVALIVIRKRI